MAAAAQVLEGAVAVEADRRALGRIEVVDDLHLERLAPLLEQRDRIGTRKVAGSLEREIGGLLLAHLGLDLLEVGGRQRARQVEVVVEAILDGGADAELRLREDLQDRRGHHVRRRMAHRGQVIPSARVQGGAGVRADLVSVDRHAAKGSAWGFREASAMAPASASDALELLERLAAVARSDRSPGTGSARTGCPSSCCEIRSTGTRRWAGPRARRACPGPARRASARAARIRCDAAPRVHPARCDRWSRAGRSSPRRPTSSPRAPIRSPICCCMTPMAGQPTNVGSSSMRTRSPEAATEPMTPRSTTLMAGISGSGRVASSSHTRRSTPSAIVTRSLPPHCGPPR